jgi:maltooligosyltrehalose trehalohydrolase
VSATWVWAPRASRVEIETDRGRRAMAPDGSGRWIADGDPSNGDYRIAIDGGQPLPDPRSSWQPAGVHGPSRGVDHEAFAWSETSFRARSLASAVLYELHVGTFTPAGTFESAIDRLDHLVDLGITHVELMPVTEFPGAHGWGYDGVDLFAPHHSYGGPDGLKRLVDACHRRGLAVLLDVVYNHLGPSGNYLARFGPYFTDRYHTPWGPAVNFDGPGSDQVRRFVCDNAAMWLRDYHFDGLRLDAVHAIYDASAIHVLEQLAEEVDALAASLGRPLALIAESDLNDPRLVRSRDAGGYGLDAQWSDDFHHALHTVLSGERDGYYADFGSLADLAAALERAFVYVGQHSAHRGRRHGRSPGGIPGHRFVAFLQNHDQVGNRALGERSSHLLTPGQLKVGATILLTSPFVPLLFQGEEWGASTPFLYFTDHDDPELARAVSEGRCREFAAFGWSREEIPDPQAPETFARSKLAWAEISLEPHRSLLDWHRELIALRERVPALTDGRLDRVRVRYDETARWLAIERGPVTVACNLAPAPGVVALGGAARILLASEAEVQVNGHSVHLPPESVAICAPEGWR